LLVAAGLARELVIEPDQIYSIEVAPASQARAALENGP
jgi:hypothetical protein